MKGSSLVGVCLFCKWLCFILWGQHSLFSCSSRGGLHVFGCVWVVLPLYLCAKAELGFVLGGSICIENLGLLLLGAALELKWSNCCEHGIKYSLQNCINILIKPVHSRSEAEISAVHAIEFFFLCCSLCRLFLIRSVLFPSSFVFGFSTSHSIFALSCF